MMDEFGEWEKEAEALGFMVACERQAEGLRGLSNERKSDEEGEKSCEKEGQQSDG